MPILPERQYRRIDIRLIAMKNSHGYFYILSLMVVVASALSACKTAKLSDADEALARGGIFQRPENLPSGL